jgi:hypothetical protein
MCWTISGTDQAAIGEARLTLAKLRCLDSRKNWHVFEAESGAIVYFSRPPFNNLCAFNRPTSARLIKALGSILSQYSLMRS